MQFPKIITGAKDTLLRARKSVSVYPNGAFIVEVPYLEQIQYAFSV